MEAIHAATGLLPSVFFPRSWKGGAPCDNASNLITKLQTYITNMETTPARGWIVVNVYRKNVSMWQIPGGGNTFFAGPDTSVIPIITAGANYVGPLPTNYLLAAAPNVQTQLSMTRWAAAAFTISSSTTSTTNAALSGLFTGTAVTDLRNLTSWSSADLMQNAMTDKDAVGQVQCFNGLTCYQGPDIRSEVTVATYSNLISSLGDGSVQSVQLPLNLPTPVQVFVSPYYTTTASAPTIGLSCEATNPQAPTTLNLRLKGAAFTGTGNDVYLAIMIGTFGFDGSLLTTRVVQVTATEDNMSGTQVLSVSLNRWLSDECIIGYGVSIQGLTTCEEAVLDIVTHMQYRQETVGSYRIMHWENFTTNQNIQFRGEVMLEGVPAGNLVPYVKGEVNAGYGNPGTIMALRALFTSKDTVYRRVYSGQGMEPSNAALYPSVDHNLVASCSGLLPMLGKVAVGALSAMPALMSAFAAGTQSHNNAGVPANQPNIVPPYPLTRNLPMLLASGAKRPRMVDEVD